MAVLRYPSVATALPFFIFVYTASRYRTTSIRNSAIYIVSNPLMSILCISFPPSDPYL